MQYYTHIIESCLDIIVNPIKESALLDPMYVVSAVPGNAYIVAASILKEQMGFPFVSIEALYT